jgi:hypothetical protein
MTLLHVLSYLNAFAFSINGLLLQPSPLQRNALLVRSWLPRDSRYTASHNNRLRRQRSPCGCGSIFILAACSLALAAAGKQRSRFGANGSTYRDGGTSAL